MILPANILKYATATTIGLVLVAAIVVLGFLLHKSYQASAGMEWEIQRLEDEIEPLQAERDSLKGIILLRADSLRANRQVADSLLSANARLRRALRRMNVDTRPDFSFTGTDSSLAAVADSILRSRGGYD